MVFFTCDACGESLKKNAVEKHYQFQCRNCSVLSCVDCGKDFPGDSYKEHIRCVSEEEKYSGKDYKPKANANKGETKQMQWTEQVQSAISKCRTDPKLKSLLERLMDYPNIPRKKAKFQNFVKNSMGVRDAGLCERVWDVITAEMTPPQCVNGQKNDESKSTPKENSQQTEHNGIASTDTDNSTDIKTLSEKKLNKRERKEERRKLQNKEEKKEKKKKRKRDDDEENEEVPSKRKKNVEAVENGKEEETEPKKKHKKKKHKAAHEADNEEEECIEEDRENSNEETTGDTSSGRFTWEGAIVGVLRKADDQELSVKKLRKKVLAQYYEYGGNGKIKTEEELLAKFTKKIKKNPRLRALKDRVKLLH